MHLNLGLWVSLGGLRHTSPQPAPATRFGVYLLTHCLSRRSAPHRPPKEGGRHTRGAMPAAAATVPSLSLSLHCYSACFRHTLSPQHSRTHTLSHTLARSHALSRTLTHTLARSLHTHTLTHTLTHSITHALLYGRSGSSRGSSWPSSPPTSCAPSPAGESCPGRLGCLVGWGSERAKQAGHKWLRRDMGWWLGR